MRRCTVAIIIGIAVTPAAVASAQEAIEGVDLFIDMEKYIGRQVLLTDGHVFGADSESILVHAGMGDPVLFVLSVNDIDRETFRYLLKNCARLGTGPECHVPLLVTPTGQKTRAGAYILGGARLTTLAPKPMPTDLHPLPGKAAGL
jgi:hypothetical protein